MEEVPNVDLMHLNNQEDSEDPEHTIGYRRCVSAFVIQKVSGLVFAAERINEAGAWQIPQGGVEAAERDHEAVLRELWEETGIRSVRFLKGTRSRYDYDFPDHVIKKRYDHGWQYYKGQSLRFFLLEFIGEESEINLHTSPEAVEFSQWKWMAPESLVNQMVDFKKRAIQLGAQELGLI